MIELLYFKIIHQSSETGLDEEIAKYPSYSSLSEEDRKNTLDAIEQIYEEMWQAINNELNLLDFKAYSAVKVYRDSIARIPNNDRDQNLPPEKKYQNHPHYLKQIYEKSVSEKAQKTIFNLLERGAILEGTEIKTWWICHHHYQRIKDFLYDKIPNILYRTPLLSKKALPAIESFIIAKRDQFIARTIDKTLKDRELGILFMGAAHMVDLYLLDEVDITVYKFDEEETSEKLYKLYTHLAGVQ